MAPAEVPKVHWRSRIVGHGTIDPSELLANPQNWRIHPTHQRHALKDVLKQVGWVQDIVVNKTTGHLIDGHLRADLAVEEGETEVPFVEVELSEEEERLVLATLDPLSALAVADAEQLNALLSDLAVDGDVLEGFLADLAQAQGPPPETLPQSPDPADFWPRVSFQLPPQVYSEWRDRFEEQPGEADHEKISAILRQLEPKDEGVDFE